MDHRAALKSPRLMLYEPWRQRVENFGGAIGVLFADAHRRQPTIGKTRVKIARVDANERGVDLGRQRWCFRKCDQLSLFGLIRGMKVHLRATA